MSTSILAQIIRHLASMSALVIVLWVVVRDGGSAMDLVKLAGLVRNGIERCCTGMASSGARVTGCSIGSSRNAGRATRKPRGNRSGMDMDAFGGRGVGETYVVEVLSPARALESTLHVC